LQDIRSLREYRRFETAFPSLRVRAAVAFKTTALELIPGARFNLGIPLFGVSIAASIPPAILYLANPDQRSKAGGHG
jgi:hypothetical protein